MGGAWRRAAVVLRPEASPSPFPLSPVHVLMPLFRGRCPEYTSVCVCKQLFLLFRSLGATASEGLGVALEPRRILAASGLERWGCLVTAHLATDASWGSSNPRQRPRPLPLSASSSLASPRVARYLRYPTLTRESPQSGKWGPELPIQRPCWHFSSTSILFPVTK